MKKEVRKSGVTLVELLFVVIILVVLAAVVVPQIRQSTKKANIQECEVNILRLEDAMESFRAENGFYPEELDKIAYDSSYFSEGPPFCRITCEEYNLSPTEEGKVDMTYHMHEL